MTVLTKTKFVPIPEGVYNLKIVKFETKEQKAQPGTFYYLWTIQVLDTLPEEFIGKDTFGVITAMELTENNNLSKFLTNVGIAVDVGEDIDIDTLINFKFVGKIIISTNQKSGKANNGLGTVTIPEYKNFEARQQRGGSTAKPVQRQAAAPAPAPAPAVRQPVAQSVQRPAARPTAAVPASAPRPVVRMQKQVEQPVVDEDDVGGAVPADDDGGVEKFPDEA